MATQCVNSSLRKLRDELRPWGTLLHPLGRSLGRDWEWRLTFYPFPTKHWVHLRTSNPIESPFAALGLRTDAAKRFKMVHNATAVIWKMLLVAQQRFRRLNAPELMKEVYGGAQYVNGVRAQELPWEAAA